MGRKKIDRIRVSTKLYHDTVQKMRVLASFESQDFGKVVSMQDWTDWMVCRAYDAAIILRGRKVSLPSKKK